MNTKVLDLNNYRQYKQLRQTTNNVEEKVKVYKHNNTYSIIRVKNNRMYRVIGENLIEIMINHIPTEWTLLAIYKALTDNNLRALYNTIFV